MKDDAALALVPAPPRTRVALALLWLLPVGLAAYALRGTLSGAGDGASVAGAVASICFVAAISLAATFAGFRALRRHRLILDGNGLVVESGFHRERTALSELDLEQARLLDLGERREFRPSRKVRGQRLPVPGFQGGWYWLRNRQRAFVARAGGNRVLWIPTARGSGLLLQPQRPRELLEHLREAAASVGAAHDARSGPAPRRVEEPQYWFPAKQYGWGWGVPATWQGWVVLGGFVAGVLVLGHFASDERSFLLGIIPLVLVLFAICFLKGERPRWRWGDDDR